MDCRVYSLDTVDTSMAGAAVTRYDALARSCGGRRMKRRSRAGGKPVKALPRKALKLKPRKASNAVTRRGSAPADPTEVARLTRELNDALERQSATAQVLSAISRSNFELQPILQSVVDTASHLCRADTSVIFRLEGGVYQFAAGYSLDPAYLEHERRTPISPGPGTVIGRAAMTRKVVQIEDASTDPLYEQKAAIKISGGRSMIGVPLMREGEPVGVMGLARTRVDPFAQREIDLVTTFADQAVIAIENTRLFEAEQQRTRELTESLQEQTATSEVLQVISSSPGDLAPVFSAILEAAIRVCGANFGVLLLYEGSDLWRAATTQSVPQKFREWLLTEPRRWGPETNLGRVAQSKRVVQIADVWTDSESAQTDPSRIAFRELAGGRTSLGVPLLKGDELIGALAFFRQQVHPFTDKQIALAQNFARQAVIAIENARLLKELRDRTDQLEAQSQEVVKLNQQLEQRVADQVGEIERMGRLRRFLPPQVADLIVASGTEKQLESHRREITALFCDLRGFTGFSEASAPEDVMALLRDYHAAIGEIIIKYSGTLERYAGDGVMVVFNDPVPVDNPALRAVQMALETREAIGALTEKWRRLGHDIGFGIGIEHGHATLGTIGYEGRFDYAAIGTVSNVASRLCDEAKPGQILISPRVLMAVEDVVKVEPVGEFTLKGIRRPLAVYNVLEAASPNA
jgi:adenylate cyclase